MDYFQKYRKYKSKYLALKGGGFAVILDNDTFNKLDTTRQKQYLLDTDNKAYPKVITQNEYDTLSNSDKDKYIEVSGPLKESYSNGTKPSTFFPGNFIHTDLQYFPDYFSDSMRPDDRTFTVIQPYNELDNLLYILKK